MLHYCSYLYSAWLWRTEVYVELLVHFSSLGTGVIQLNGYAILT